MSKPLTPTQAACVYDRIGPLQDWQSFYEGPAVEELLSRGRFQTAEAVYELGPGTGALAERLLADVLPGSARYMGVDVSPRMVRLTRERLHRWAERARVEQTEGALPLPGGDGGYDRFLSVYVFDLLPPDYAKEVLGEAARLLSDDGLICLVSLTAGTSPLGRAVAWAWRRLWQADARLTGGCRPVDLRGLLVEDGWRLSHRGTVEAWGISSEVVVAVPPGRR